MRTIPFNTATPNKAINPTPAEILKGIPRKYKAQMPPMADKGIAVNMSSDCLTELKVRYNKTKINAKAAGTANISLARAFCKFSKAPPANESVDFR